MPIRILSPEVAGKIAAGEVIERPASVVKELLENSIDAGASEVRVEIREGGRRLIRVADTGGGIPADEVPLAFARHATSKLSSVADLERIGTLGFRGEALASIAAVSHITVVTRPREQIIGQLLRVEGGEITRHEGHGCPTGTTITVEHLFREVPARLKFLRQPQTEAGHIYTVVSHYAMAYPEIQFSLTSDGRPTFRSSGTGQPRDVLIAVHGLELVESMVAIERPQGEESAPTVTGYIGRPSLHRAHRGYITFFVNRRWVQDRSLVHAVTQAYHTLLPIGRFPVAILFLELNVADVDVNVHPTKREVKFRDGRTVFNAVQKAVRQALIRHSPVPTMAFAPRTWSAPEWERRQDLLRAGSDSPNASQLAIELVRPPDRAGELQPVGPVRLPLLRVVGQLGQTYVVAEGPQGLYLIDQHAAHERVLYERLLAAHQQHVVGSQAILEPLTLDLDPLLAGTLAESLSFLNQVGFAIDPFGGTTFLLRAVPAIIGTPDVRSALVDVLELLRDHDNPLALRAEQRIIAAVCKRAAIKAGQALSNEAMQQLVRQLEQCESPRTCPHGRPTVLHFSVEQLEKEFARR